MGKWKTRTGVVKFVVRDTCNDDFLGTMDHRAFLSSGWSDESPGFTVLAVDPGLSLPYSLCHQGFSNLNLNASTYSDFSSESFHSASSTRVRMEDGTPR